jgi:di/tricarboxylate transporter
MDVVLVSILLAVVIFLLVSEKLPVDLTAIGILAVLPALGLLTPAEALVGFANPAPVTIAALLVVARGLVRTGGLKWLAGRFVDWTGGRPRPLLALSLGLAGLFSAFINNTPVVVLFIGMFLAFCSTHGLSPSKFLLPISYVSILAGTCTLIGTSTNILVSDLGMQYGCRPIGMFELSSLGVPIALLGGLFLFLVGPRLLPDHRSPICEGPRGDRARYISELRVPGSSPLVGQEPREALTAGHPELEVYEVLRAEAVFDPNSEAVLLEPDDILLVKGSASDLVELLDAGQVQLAVEPGLSSSRPFEEGIQIVELIVPPGSEVDGLSVELAFGASEPSLQVIGVLRGHAHFSGAKLADLKLATGDILLVQCPTACVNSVRARGEVIVLEEVLQSIVVRRRAPLALGIFLVMIGLVSAGVADILVGSLGAAFLMIVTGCVSLRGAYRSIDVKVLLLLIGTIALGAALQKTGASELYAHSFLNLFSGAGPGWILGAIVFLTSVLSHFMSNGSTAVLMVPVALAAASALGLDPRPFLIGICFGASACFATPIGYQTNLLVYAPGGYRFSDFIKLGLPLSLFVCLAASLAIPLVWPF